MIKLKIRNYLHNTMIDVHGNIYALRYYSM